ncbi:hypothetical protein ARTHRO9AX_150227 [Arthrobacter sp. 9AX]|nr:hypothetical protein ARTHRO9AX_150227 [Arthrobacter sp. 9AX]
MSSSELPEKPDYCVQVRTRTSTPLHADLVGTTRQGYRSARPPKPRCESIRHGYVSASRHRPGRKVENGSVTSLPDSEKTSPPPPQISAANWNARLVFPRPVSNRGDVLILVVRLTTSLSPEPAAPGAAGRCGAGPGHNRSPFYVLRKRRVQGARPSASSGVGYAFRERRPRLSGRCDAHCLSDTWGVFARFFQPGLKVFCKNLPVDIKGHPTPFGGAK